ncbi:unnamed protein product [Pedinophyceae sp. YPF-701]|nr:unnamed protein product [Pedinophyceae sp. YPF-701]
MTRLLSPGRIESGRVPESRASNATSGGANGAGAGPEMPASPAKRRLGRRGWHESYRPREFNFWKGWQQDVPTAAKLGNPGPTNFDIYNGADWCADDDLLKTSWLARMELLVLVQALIFAAFIASLVSATSRDQLEAAEAFVDAWKSVDFWHLLVLSMVTLASIYTMCATILMSAVGYSVPTKRFRRFLAGPAKVPLSMTLYMWQITGAGCAAWVFLYLATLGAPWWMLLIVIAFALVCTTLLMNVVSVAFYSSKKLGILGSAPEFPPPPTGSEAGDGVSQGELQDLAARGGLSSLQEEDGGERRSQERGGERRRHMAMAGAGFQ